VAPTPASGDICPANWRLPTAGASSELAWLNAKMVNPAATAPSVASTSYAGWQYTGAFKGVLSGSKVGLSFQGQGTNGYYWSSSINTDSTMAAGSLQFNSSYVAPGNVGTGRNMGASVRCLADNPLTVKFGGAQATNVTIVDNGDGTQTLTAVTSAHAAGLVEVTIDNGLTSFTFPAVWADTGTSTSDNWSLTNIASGFLYEDLAITLTLDTYDINLTGQIGQVWSDDFIANVNTNNPVGYNLTIQASEPRLSCNLGGSNYYIQPLTGTGTMANNRWGYAVGGAPSSWTGVTNSSVSIKSFTTATDRNLGDDTTAWIGTKVDLSQPTCSYVGTLVLTAVTR
jgi:hypothetical protein